MGVTRSGLKREDKLDLSDETTLKCYRCFRTETKWVCHHCGRYICEKCEPCLIRWLRRLRLCKFFFRDHEFFDIYPLEGDFRKSTHCRDHIHYEESFMNVLIWLIGGLGIFVLILSPFLASGRGLAIKIGGLTLLAFLVLLPMRGRIYRFVMTDHSTRLCPLFARYKVDITENVTTDFAVKGSSADYLRIDPQSPDNEGKVTVTILLTPEDYERCESTGWSKNGDRLRFSAGYFGLDNVSQVNFNQPPVVSYGYDKNLPSDQESVHHSGRLHLSGEIPLSEYKRLCHRRDVLKIQQRYQVKEKAGWVGPRFDREFPFWIVPNLTPAGEGLILSIYVAADIKGKTVLEQLTLKVPRFWYEQVDKTDGVPDGVRSEIRWTKRLLSHGINRLYVRFARPVKGTVVLSGKYKISVSKFLLSKLSVREENLLWYPNGEPVLPGKRRLQDVVSKTEFAGRIEIDTSTIVTQLGFISDSPEEEELGLRPDHRVVNVIINALRDDVDIESVVENPARIGEVRTGAQLWDRYWEINGHLYEQDLIQYEVHVIVYGQENQAIPFDQEFVKWRLYLRSCSPIDDEKQVTRLESVRGILHSKIETHLRQHRQRSDENYE